MDASVHGRPLADLYAVQGAQIAHQATCEQDAALAENSVAWLMSVGQAARTFLSGPQRNARGVTVALDVGSAAEYSDDPYKTWLAGYGDEDIECSLVTIWQDSRMTDLPDEDAGTAAGAFLSVLRKLDVSGKGPTTTLETEFDVGRLADQLATDAAVRARTMREAAVKAAARAEAAMWKLLNPSESARGLSLDQADLIIALCNSVKAYRRENGGRSPRARVKVLDAIARGPLNKHWTKARAIKVAESISVPWPLPGCGGSPIPRQLYIKGEPGSGRRSHVVEEDEAQVLVEAVEHLRPLAEQVFAEPSGE